MAYAFASKLVEPFTAGLVGLLVVVLWALCHITSRRVRFALVAAVAIPWAAAWPPTAWLALRGLEHRYVDRGTDAGPDDPIVLLGGGVRRQPDVGWDLADDSLVRTVHAARLYHTLGPRPVVVSGGAPPHHPEAAVAYPMRALLMRLGVAADHILLDDRSRTTFENGVETKRLLGDRPSRRIVLVTQAFHLPRSVRVFEALGFDVLPAGCDRVTIAADFRLTHLLPDGLSARRTALAAHEYLGGIYYRVRGRM